MGILLANKYLPLLKGCLWMWLQESLNWVWTNYPASEHSSLHLENRALQMNSAEAKAKQKAAKVSIDTDGVSSDLKLVIPMLLYSSLNYCWKCLEVLLSRSHRTSVWTPSIKTRQLQNHKTTAASVRCNRLPTTNPSLSEMKQVPFGR